MNEAEVQFYKEYISRLTHELLLCQGNSDKDWSRYEPKVELPSTLFEEQTLSPLFYSYDMRIEELRSVIEQQGTYLDLVTQRMNYLLDENQSFRNKQTDFLRVPFNETSNQERPVTLEEERLQGDNQLLIQQSDLLIEELRNVNSAISEREKTINGLSLDLEKKVELIAQYEKKLELSEKKLRTAEHELSKEKRTVQTLKKQFNELLSNDSQRAALLHSTLMENKEYEVDVTDWSQRVITSIISAQELQENLLMSRKENASLSDERAQLGQELRRSETHCSELEQSLRVKDRQLESCKKMIEDIQRDKASLQLTAKESEIAHEKAETICKTLQQEHNFLVRDQMERANQRNTDIKLVIDALAENQLDRGNGSRISELNRRVVDLEIQVGQLTRENELNNAMNAKLRSSLETEKDTFEAIVADLSLSMNETTAKLVQEQQNRLYSEEGKKEVESKLRMIEVKFDTMSNALSQEKDRRMSDKEEYNRTIKTMEETWNTAVQNISKQCKQLEAEKILLAKKLDESNVYRCDEIFFLQVKVEQAEKTIVDLTNELENQNIHHRTILMETLNKKKMIIDELERSLGDALEMEKQLSEEMKALLQRNTQWNSDKLQHRKVLEEKERTISDLSIQLAIAQQKLAVISKQLCDNVEEQRERIQREYYLKAEIQGMRMNSLSGNE